ncbi:MAG TPA: prepilin-type N-terminal cleavage/methylation domain-containing protein [bacterium]
MKRKIRAGQAKNRGFTLVEIIIVIVVVGIVAGSITVNVDELDRTARLDGAGMRALSEIRQAQEIAIAQNRLVDFKVYTASNTFEAKYNDTGEYVRSVAGGDLSVQFNTGEYKDVTMVSSQTGTTLSFLPTTGEPFLSGSRFSGVRVVFSFHSRASQTNLVVYSSGYCTLQKVVDKGCGC